MKYELSILFFPQNVCSSHSFIVFGRIKIDRSTNIIKVTFVNLRTWEIKAEFKDI